MLAFRETSKIMLVAKLRVSVPAEIVGTDSVSTYDLMSSQVLDEVLAFRNTLAVVTN